MSITTAEFVAAIRDPQPWTAFDTLVRREQSAGRKVAAIYEDFLNHHPAVYDDESLTEDQQDSFSDTMDALSGFCASCSAYRDGKVGYDGGQGEGMSMTVTPLLDMRQTDETRLVEEAIRSAGFSQVDAYRFNAASIRVRVIDERFEGLSFESRLALVESCLEQLPERTQADIISLYLFAPSGLSQPPESAWQFLMNREFDEPSQSTL